MAEVAEVEDGVVIIDCVAIVCEEGEGGEHYRDKNRFRCWVFLLVSLPLTGAACETVEIVNPMRD